MRENQPAGWPSSASGGGDRLLSKRNIGVILFSVRDAVSRDPTTTDLPSGFREVLERMAEIGYEQIGFAGYGQSANAAGGANPGSTNPAAYLAYARTLRGFLDEFGLKANGTHAFIPGSLTPLDPKHVLFEMDIFWAHVAQHRFRTYTAPGGSAQTDMLRPRWNGSTRGAPLAEAAVPAVPRQGREAHGRPRRGSAAATAPTDPMRQ